MGPVGMALTVVTAATVGLVMAVTAFVRNHRPTGRQRNRHPR